MLKSVPGSFEIARRRRDADGVGPDEQGRPWGRGRWHLENLPKRQGGRITLGRIAAVYVAVLGRDVDVAAGASRQGSPDTGHRPDRGGRRYYRSEARVEGGKRIHGVGAGRIGPAAIELILGGEPILAVLIAYDAANRFIVIARRRRSESAIAAFDLNEGRGRWLVIVERIGACARRGGVGGV